MLKDYFMRYLTVNPRIGERSRQHYITGINAIHALLNEMDFPIKNLYHIDTLDALEAVKKFLMSNDVFIAKNRRGNSMYSAAFNHFYRFATNLHQTGLPSIRLMDAVMERPEQKQPYSISRWERNQILVDQAIQSAGYCCEHKREHRTFLSQSTHHMYMEGHHIIPLKLQGTFPCSLDIYANIVSLCPTCHRLLHYGIFNDKKPVVDVIFSNRQDRLATCGVKLSDSEIMEFYQ